MAQPAAQFQSRELVRAEPFCSPNINIQAVAAAGTLIHNWDVFTAVCDRNALTLDGPGASGRDVIGPFLDVILFSDQASTLDVRFWAGTSAGASRSVMTGGVPLVVAASTLTLVAGLRVVGRGVVIIFVNTAGVAANVEFTSMVRSV